MVNRNVDFEPTKRGRKHLVPVAEPFCYVLARLRASVGHGPTDRVFFRADGRPWNKWAVEQRFGKVVDAAAIPPIRFHDLRRTIASRLKRGGVHETETQRLLGRRTLAMADRYINVEVEQLRTAMAVLPGASTRATQEFLARTRMTQEREVSDRLSGNSLN